MAKPVKASDLILDDRNANLGKEFGDSVLEKSISKLGLGRSILVDKDFRVIAGNKTAEKSVELGIEDIIVVPTDGKKLVVVQRTDLSLDSKRGRELALADNRVSEVNLDWDMGVVGELQTEFDVDSIFCPEPKPKKGKAMWIKVTITDEDEMTEAAEEIEGLVMSKWSTAEVKVNR